jgi:antitoxin component YwqK of YwqJK toxin-antitoxin module
MKHFLLACFAAFCLSANAQKDYSRTYDSDSIINTGVGLHDQEKYDDAVNQYERVVANDPQFLRAQYEKAISLSASEKTDALRAHFEKLYGEKRMAEYPGLYTLYGSFLSDQKEYDRSAKIFREGEQYQPNSSNFLFNMAVLYIRKEEYQTAVDLLKRVIMLNPSHASAHYMLGLMAYENGKIVEGTLCMVSYLALAPDGRYAKDAILKLNSKYSQNFVGPSKVTFSEKGDDFKEMETVLRSQLPLKSAYKVKSDIDDVCIRQAQAVMEYAAGHKMGEGFFETIYIPWVADMYKRGQFENFSYFMLISLEENLGKKLTSHKKEITAYIEQYVAQHFWNEFGKRRQEHFGKVQDVIITVENGVPNMVGPRTNGKNDGMFKLLNRDGKVIGELQYKAGVGEGLQKYYDEKGILLKESSYANDELNGEMREYYENGNLKSIQNYKNGKLHGDLSSFFYNGGKMCELHFSEDQREGVQVCYYQNGTKKNEWPIKNGKTDGTYLSYNKAGDLTAKYQYVDDQLDGDYLEYYDGKTLKTEGKYSKGIVVGSIKTYYPNKTLQEETFYENGKIKRSVSYATNGKMENEALYDAKGELESYAYYDWNEKKYFVEKYKNGEVKTATQYTRDKPDGYEVSKKPYVICDYYGETTAKGDMGKTGKEREWQYFYSSNVLRSKELFDKGEREGQRYDYARDGKLTSALFYSKGKVNGIAERYNGGAMTQSVYYLDGEQNGPFQTYYPDGKVSGEGFYVEGEMQYGRYYYLQSGKINTKITYYDDDAIKAERYGADGVKESEFDFKNKTGKFGEKFYGGLTKTNIDFVNGKRNGKYVFSDKYDNPIAETHYLNGEETGVSRMYHASNKLASEGTYYNGDYHGTVRSYDLAGNLMAVENYAYGDNYGPYEGYFYNGKKMHECQLFDGERDGEMKYYNLAGEHIVSLLYENGRLLGYLRKNAAGAVADRIELKTETGDIISKYPNGKTAFSVKAVKGLWDGNLSIFGADGKPEVSINYANGRREGEHVEYYADGKPYKRERFRNDELDGKLEYFDAAGKMLLTAEYANAERHGDFKMYNNGTLLFTKKYDSDELVAISK